MAHPNSEPRTPEWAMKVIEAIYKLWQEKVGHRIRRTAVGRLSL
jgi:hypothetical protein